jgi:hypothetical protein
MRTESQNICIAIVDDDKKVHESIGWPPGCPISFIPTLREASPVGF